MATSMSDSAGSGVDPDGCDNAGQFVRRRLSAGDEPLSPSELADAYECRKGYMRSVVSDLAGEGVIDRLSRGRYVIEDGDESDLSDDENGFSLTLSDENGADSPDGDTDESEGNQMPTDSEYRRQHAESEAESEGGESTEKESDSAGIGGVGAGDVAAVASGFDPRMLMLAASTAVAVFLVYQSFSGSGDGAYGAYQDDDDDDYEFRSGGLIG